MTPQFLFTSFLFAALTATRLTVAFLTGTFSRIAPPWGNKTGYVAQPNIAQSNIAQPPNLRKTHQSNLTNRFGAASPWPSGRNRLTTSVSI